MSREHFSFEEERLRGRLLMLKDLVAEQELHALPCPLLAEQLNELKVLCRRLQVDIQSLSECVDKAINS